MKLEIQASKPHGLCVPGSGRQPFDEGKRRYRTPRLTRLGSVRELTRQVRQPVDAEERP